MTFIVGVCGKDRCYIAADAMVTLTQGTIDGATATSLGQARRNNMDDCAFKIFTPFRGCIVGLAGDAEAGKKMIEQLRNETPETFEEIKEFLKNVTNRKNRAFSLIIGYYDKETKSNKLVKWMSQTPDSFEEEDLLMAGSGEAFFGGHLPQMVASIKASKLSPEEDMGVNLSAILNQALVKTNGKLLGGWGVGGCFYSIGLHGPDLVPQEDTALLYVEYVERGDKAKVSVKGGRIAYREGILFVNGPFGQQRPHFNDMDVSAATLDRMRRKEPPFSTEDMWRQDNVKNLEIHFRDDRLASQTRRCQPRELFSYNETGIVLSPLLVGEITRMINNPIF